MDQYGEDDGDDRKSAADLRACVASLDSLEGETVRGELSINANWLTAED